MFSITESEVENLVSDAKSLAAGRPLATDAKWLRLSFNQRGVWGEAVGSGKNPYQTQIDTRQWAFRCTCPSRQFPCKHGVGLLFLMANKSNLFQQKTEEPDWAKDWFDKRAQKHESAPPPVSEPESDPENDKKAAQKAKTADARAQKVADATAEIDLVLRDWVRTGILNLTEQNGDYFQKIAARMLDNQAKGLANALLEFPKIGWYPNPTDRQAAFLGQIAHTFLLNEAYKNIDRIDDPTAVADLKTLIGYPQSAKNLLENPDADRVTDHWYALATYTQKEDDLLVRRQWFVGAQSSRFALLLDFAPNEKYLQPPLLVHRWHHLALSFFPSRVPLRAVVGQIPPENAQKPQPALQVMSDWTEAHQDFSEKLAKLPFLDQIPQIVDQLKPIFDGKNWFLEDRNGNAMPFVRTVGQSEILSVLAATGGAPAPFFILRNHQEIDPMAGLSVEFGQQYFKKNKEK